MIIKLFEIISAVTTIVCLWCVKRNKKWWLIYAAGTVLYIIVCAHAKQYAYSIMGIILMCTGLKNYFYKGKKND